MLKPLHIAITTLALGALALPSSAQIKNYSMREMVLTADGAVSGQIINSVVFRVDSETDGPELYFTTLTIEGTELNRNAAVTVDVTFAGGFIDPDHGVYNSEAPSADETKIGTNVLVFYKWSDNLGGDVKGNGIVASHGGIYRTANGPSGPIVLGKGEGFAIQSNTSVVDLESAVRKIKKS